MSQATPRGYSDVAAALRFTDRSRARCRRRADTRDGLQARDGRTKSTIYRLLMEVVIKIGASGIGTLNMESGLSPKLPPRR